MQTKFWVRRVVLATVWALGVSTWASIAHYLFALPDVALILAVLTIAFIMLRPATRGSATDRRSRVTDTAMHQGAPTP